MLDIIRKGAKQMRFTIVEALQGRQSFSWCSRECMRQQYVKCVLTTSMLYYPCWLSGKKSWPSPSSLVKEVKLWNILNGNFETRLFTFHCLLPDIFSLKSCTGTTQIPGCKKVSYMLVFSCWQRTEHLMWILLCYSDSHLP